MDALWMFSTSRRGIKSTVIAWIMDKREASLTLNSSFREGDATLYRVQGDLLA